MTHQGHFARIFVMVPDNFLKILLPVLVSMETYYYSLGSEMESSFQLKKYTHYSSSLILLFLECL